MKDFVHADYTFSNVPSPTLCEAVQRALDDISPKLVLHVEGFRATVQGPMVVDAHHAAGVMYDFIEAMKAVDSLREWQMRRRITASHRSAP